MFKDEYENKLKLEQIPWDYEGEICHNEQMCRHCHNDLIREQIRIELYRTGSFKTMPDIQKAMMLANGQLPSNMCWFCAARMPDGPHYYSKNIYRCDECAAEGLTLKE